MLIQPVGRRVGFEKNQLLQFRLIMSAAGGGGKTIPIQMGHFKMLFSCGVDPWGAPWLLDLPLGWTPGGAKSWGKNFISGFGLKHWRTRANVHTRLYANRQPGLKAKWRGILVNSVRG